MSHLPSNGKINLGALRELARKDIVTLLEKCPGTKAIIWDDHLTGPIGLVAEYSFLKEMEVIKMFQLKPGRLPAVNVKNIIFITRPDINLIKIICDNLKTEESQAQSRKDYHLFFVPTRSTLCEKYLKENNVHSLFSNIEELPIEFYPLDSDVISMELHSTFKEMYVENDLSCLHQIARGLITLQAVYGPFPNILGKGNAARQVNELMMRLRRQTGADTEPLIQPQFDTLLIVDRGVDLVSPLVTQLTYEGLIDEFFSIRNSSVKLPAEKFQNNSEQSPPFNEKSTDFKQFVLNSSDTLFKELRDKNFSAVGPTLSRKAKAITAQFEERHEARTVSELKQFVAKLPQMQTAKQSLAQHTSIAELIKEITDTEPFLEALQVEQDMLNGIDTDKAIPYIEDCIFKQDPLIKVLRLVCLQSACNSGLKQRVLEQYKREILQTYGYEHFVTLQNLENSGLLRLQQSNRPFAVLRRALRLTADDVNEVNPTDISYVHSIYAPLSVRLCQNAAKPGWKSLQDVISLLPGPVVQESQPLPINLRKRRNSGSSGQSSADDTRTTLVFFIGGCTFAEISALRFLSRQDEEYLIATTNIINGSSFLESLYEPLEAVPVI